VHRENWLAEGSQPILVDAELIAEAEPILSRAGAKSKYRPSLPTLLQTGLLPLVSRDRAGFYRGIAPLDSAISQTPLPTCWPRYRRSFQEPSKYVSDLVRGFAAVANLFDDPQIVQRFYHEVILRSGGQSHRVLLRATAQYVRLLRNSCEARNMLSTGERWRRVVRECCASAANRRVGVAEARALLSCDIPKFMTRRRALVASWKQFSTAIAELKSAPRLLRRRVLLGAQHRRARKT
jgi:lantibiotic modifying enzyme